jgi:hypothetical protein
MNKARFLFYIGHLCDRRNQWREAKMQAAGKLVSTGSRCNCTPTTPPAPIPQLAVPFENDLYKQAEKTELQQKCLPSDTNIMQLFQEVSCLQT